MTRSTSAIPVCSSPVHSRPHARSGARGGVDIFKRWWTAYWVSRTRRTTVLMLRALDDHTLRDIGLDRSEIESVVYGKTGERRVYYRTDWN